MHENKNNRWWKWNYSYDGFYFITICTKDRYPYFGKIETENIILNDVGNIVNDEILKMEEKHNEIKIHEYCIMPNHLHLLIQINKNNVFNDINIVNNAVGARCIWHLRQNDDVKNKRNNELLSLFVGLTKAAISRNINTIKPFYFKWQRSFHDHIIRNENEYLKIKYYIKNNPKMWGRDRNNIY